MWNVVEPHLAEAAKRVSGLTHEHAGILPSEMVVLLAFCKQQQVDCVIESGRRFGYSTRVLMHSGDLFETYSFDISAQENDAALMKETVLLVQARKYACAHILIGDGANQIPELLSGKLHGKRCGVLIDGPKGVPAFKLYDKIQPRVAFLAVHDLHKTNEDGTPNPSYQLAVDRKLWVPENDGLGVRLGSMDWTAMQVGGYDRRDKMVKCGFHIGFGCGGEWT